MTESWALTLLQFPALALIVAYQTLEFPPNPRIRRHFPASDNSIADRYRGMCDSRLYNGKLQAPGALAMKASGDGFWEINLADGSAWFSDWFCSRLQWSEPAKGHAFSDLRPIMSAQTWEELLRKLRSHLEERTPL